MDTGEPKASPYTRSLKLDSDSLDVSMVFWPNIRSTQRSRFGSGEADPAEDSEQNSGVRFLQTLLVICLENGRPLTSEGS